MKLIRVTALVAPILFLANAAVALATGDTQFVTAGLGTDISLIGSIETEGVQVPFGVLLLATILGGWAIAGHIRS